MIRIALPEPWPADQSSAEAMQDRLRGTVDRASPGPQRIRALKQWQSRERDELSGKWSYRASG